MYHMSNDEKSNIYQFNCKRRDMLLQQANKEVSPKGKMEFVAKYFLNKLTKDQIAEIDGMDANSVMPFLYDYSYLEDFGSEHVREKQSRRYDKLAHGITLPTADIDRRGTEKINIYPTIFALKLGTCIMFASEIQRFAHDFGIKSKIISEPAFCYDHFDGKSTEGKSIQTDRIVKMLHYYNILTIDGQEYKLDIAGCLTAMDFNNNHPELPKVDPAKFYFSSTNENPFETVMTALSEAQGTL